MSVAAEQPAPPPAAASADNHHRIPHKQKRGDQYVANGDIDDDISSPIHLVRTKNNHKIHVKYNLAYLYWSSYCRSEQ